ncbi:VanZ family protein [Amphibacillus cookii]|uniref:VanZ family protein n=1 Tax=Amphibacillus cookii TaxID=767787 RepID=UPI00195AA8EB|nr:VanZ family protein [Amphibacillus cookii]MBM7540810.1 glycopeptide antibiotics resistance protein [Amphibacillus cookii]
MIENRFIIFFLISYPLWLFIRRRYVIKHKKSIGLTEEIVLQAFAIYILAVIYLTMEPFYFQLPIVGERAFSFDMNLFYQLTHMAEGYLHLQLLYTVGNILLFVPFGMLAPIVFKKMRHPLLLISMAFLFSLAIELSQALFTLTRTGTVDDLFFNTLGGLCGYFVYLYARSIGNRK